MAFFWDLMLRFVALWVCCCCHARVEVYVSGRHAICWPQCLSTCARRSSILDKRKLNFAMIAGGGDISRYYSNLRVIHIHHIRSNSMSQAPIPSADHHQTKRWPHEFASSSSTTQAHAWQTCFDSSKTFSPAPQLPMARFDSLKDCQHTFECRRHESTAGLVDFPEPGSIDCRWLVGFLGPFGLQLRTPSLPRV
jgi:hypothetical protein